jgi:hypothetical protein
MRTPIPRAFGDRHQHDVHDPDATHQQRNAGDATQQPRHNPVRLDRRLGDVRQVADGEIAPLILREPVALAQQVGDLPLRRESYICASRIGARSHETISIRFKTFFTSGAPHAALSACFVSVHDRTLPDKVTVSPLASTLNAVGVHFGAASQRTLDFRSHVSW